MKPQAQATELASPRSSRRAGVEERQRDCGPDTNGQDDENIRDSRAPHTRAESKALGALASQIVDIPSPRSDAAVTSDQVDRFGAPTAKNVHRLSVPLARLLASTLLSDERTPTMSSMVWAAVEDTDRCDASQPDALDETVGSGETTCALLACVQAQVDWETELSRILVVLSQPPVAPLEPLCGTLSWIMTACEQLQVSSEAALKELQPCVSEMDFEWITARAHHLSRSHAMVSRWVQHVEASITPSPCGAVMEPVKRDADQVSELQVIKMREAQTMPETLTPDDYEAVDIHFKVGVLIVMTLMETRESMAIDEARSLIEAIEQIATQWTSSYHVFPYSLPQLDEAERSFQAAVNDALLALVARSETSGMLIFQVDQATLSRLPLSERDSVGEVRCLITLLELELCDEREWPSPDRKRLILHALDCVVADVLAWQNTSSSTDRRFISAIAERLLAWCCMLHDFFTL